MGTDSLRGKNHAFLSQFMEERSNTDEECIVPLFSGVSHERQTVIGENGPFPFIRKKIPLNVKIHQKWGGSDHCGYEQILALDRAKADPTAAMKSGISLSVGGGLYAYMGSAME